MNTCFPARRQTTLHARFLTSVPNTKRIHSAAAAPAGARYPNQCCIIGAQTMVGNRQQERAPELLREHLDGMSGVLVVSRSCVVTRMGATAMGLVTI